MITIRPASAADHEAWLAMRQALWPGGEEEHLPEMIEYSGTDPSLRTFLAVDDHGTPCGFIEASLRPYADGCHSKPVGYVEGIYVSETVRRCGVGRALVVAAEDWARSCGCIEMSSDCLHDNEDSIRFHQSLGFAVVETLIHFRRDLPPLPDERPPSVFP